MGKQAVSRLDDWSKVRGKDIQHESLRKPGERGHLGPLTFRVETKRVHAFFKTHDRSERLMM